MHCRMKQAIGAVATFLLSAGTATAQQSTRYEVRGADVAIYNLVGTANVEAGSGAAVVVEIMRGGTDAGQLDVATGTIDGVETLRVLYPSDRVVFSGSPGQFHTTVRVRDDGTFGNGDRWDRGRGHRVEISSRGSGLDAHANLRIRVPNGQKIAVYVAGGEVTATNVAGQIRLDTQAASVTARGIKGSLTVDVGSGSVDVSDIEGDTNLDTGSGHVTLAKVTGDDVRVDTGSGSVEASDISANTFSIDTGSGSIRASNCTAQKLGLETGSGSVVATLNNNPRDVSIETGSGGVTLTVPDNFSADVMIDTGSGGIDVDLPIQLRRWERDHLEGRIGQGGGRLSIDTGSGSVHVRTRS